MTKQSETKKYYQDLIKIGMYSAGYTGVDIIDLINTAWMASVDLCTRPANDSLQNRYFRSMTTKLRDIKEYVAEHKMDCTWNIDNPVEPEHIFSKNYKKMFFKDLFNAAWNACFDLSHRPGNTEEETKYMTEATGIMLDIRNYVYQFNIDDLKRPVLRIDR